jgi:hypothetical protein
MGKGRARRRVEQSDKESHMSETWSATRVAAVDATGNAEGERGKSLETNPHATGTLEKASGRTW